MHRKQLSDTVFSIKCLVSQFYLPKVERSCPYTLIQELFLPFVNQCIRTTWCEGCFQSVNVLFLFIPSCCRCVRRTEVNLVVLWSTQSNILLLWCWNSDLRKLCPVLFILCSPDLFLPKLSAFLSHLYCFCCFSFNPTCHFCLTCMYLLPRMCFIWNAYCTVGSCFFSSWVDGNIQEKYMLPNL